MRSSLHPWLFALLACACAEKKPQHTVVNSGAYLLTLPPGWSLEEKATATGSFIATASAPLMEDESTCVLAFIPAEAFTADQVRASYVDAQKKHFGAGESTPRKLDTGFGTFEGECFHGKVPSTGAVGAVAQLAGALTSDVYAGKQGSTVVVIQVSTFAAMEHPERVRGHCASIAKSLREAPRDSGRR